MNCPICNIPMIVLELDQVEVDHCTKCGGVWLDAEEMDLLLQDSEGREEIRRRIATGDEASDEAKRRCPICSHKMEKARVSREGKENWIRIDRCGRGHGTWLDGGELDLVVGLSSFPEAHRIHDLLKTMFRGGSRRAGS